MTEGMDINSSQAGISVATAKSQGVQFTIVKMGGYNVTPMYVAPAYHIQIDRCISANMPKGHYWVTGAGDEIAQADYFVDNLYKFDKTKDILALDDEALDSNGEFWSDGKTGRFIYRVMTRLGISAKQFWLYMSVSQIRANNWPTVIASGCQIWVAVWGANDGKRVTPDLGGKMPAWDVQQYWSNAPIAGYTVSKSYSPRPVEDLFGSWNTAGSGGTGNGNVLSDQDRADLSASWDNIIGSKVADIAKSTWEHQVASAIDGGAHWIQTYAAWAQRDLERIITTLNGDDPAYVLAKESSSATVYALNIQKGTKRALTAGQFNVLQACSVGYKLVADGALAAFGADGVANATPFASFKSTINNTAVSFDASTSVDPDGTIASYSWNFGDGITATGKTASHTYANGKTYQATLTVTDNLGATSALTKSVPIGTTVTQAINVQTSPGATNIISPLTDVDYSTTTFTQVSGPAVTLTGSTPDARSFIAPAGPAVLDFSVKGFALSGQLISQANYEFTVAGPVGPAFFDGSSGTNFIDGGTTVADVIDGSVS